MAGPAMRARAAQDDASMGEGWPPVPRRPPSPRFPPPAPRGGGSWTPWLRRRDATGARFARVKFRRCAGSGAVQCGRAGRNTVEDRRAGDRAGRG
jgi:hypothetical protein